MLHQETQAWTIRDLMKFSIDHLQRHGFDEARLAVELLLSHALHCQRIELYTHFEKPLSKDELKQFRSLFERRLNHEPVQYIIGTTAFMGLQLKVDPRVLIPRPETETLVEQVMMLCNQREVGETLSILEIGTGSGNIAVALAKLMRDVEVTSIDTSAEALEVARGNAALQGVTEQISFQQLSVFDSSIEKLTRRFDQLVSNPPYVSVEEWEHLQPEIRQFEPRGAVSDSGDGYEFFRRIASIAHDLLKKDGHVVVEVGEGQAEKVQSLFRDSNLSDVRVVKDLQEIPRVVMGTYH